jgi:protein O-GlcNAc transferase
MDQSGRLAFAHALVVHKRGDLAAAEAAYRALYAQAARPKVAHMLAVALHQQHRSEEALPWFERASARPSAAFHTNYASALLAVGRGGEAEAQSRLAMAAAPDHIGARLNLALAVETQQRFDEAAAQFAELTAVPEVSQAARRGHIRCLLHAGRAQAAREVLDSTGESDDSETALLRGEIELDSGRYDLAETALDVAAESEPTRSRAWLLQARLAQQRSNRGAAQRLLDRALGLDSDDRAATLQSALLALECGDVSACLDRLQVWLTGHPRDVEAHSLYLRCAQYAPEFDAARLLIAHRQWAEMHASPAEFVPPRVRNDAEPMRIGWLSPAFRNGPIQTFLLSILHELSERRLSCNVLYNCSPRYEPSSTALRAAADRWEDVGALSDTALVRLIRENELDVLVDLAGHARGGRLAALSRRVAPVQVTWLDSFGTTGIDAMDFVLSDRVASPPGSECGFVERLLFLPRGRLCYLPPMPADRPNPAMRRFVSLNHLAKVNDMVITAWAEILRALPDWTLCLKARAGDDPIVAARLHARFAGLGVDPLRVECSGYSTLPQAFNAYREAAIALDPFPFSGGVNSCDALWMGLPLVTWPRDTLVSRQGASLLHGLSQTQWIAKNGTDYVAIVCGLAADGGARQHWSEIAAERVGECLTDASRFGEDLIAVFREAWRLRANEGFPPASR